MLSSRRRHRGFSVMEGLLASAILAFAASALLLPFSVGASNNRILVDQAAAVNLAEALLEEILSKPFYDPNGPTHLGPEAGETRRTGFDNADDYHNYSEPAGQLLDAGGLVISDPSLSVFAREVTGQYVRLPGQPSDEPPTFLRVTVRVTRDGREVCSLTRLIGRRNDRPLAGGVQL